MKKNMDKPTINNGSSDKTSAAIGNTIRVAGSGRTKFILGVIFLVLIAALFLFRPAQNPQQDAQNLVNQVSKIYNLPAGEVPTVATVVDPEKLLTVPFFKDVQKGDRLLIYANAQEMILYDPVANKILNVAPFTINK